MDYKLIDTFKQTADRIAFLDRGYGINKPDVQSAIEFVFQGSDYNFLNARSFGAVGDGVTDDTQALQNLLDAASAQARPAYIPKGSGSYMIDATKGLNIGSNTTIIFAEGAAIEAFPNDAAHYAILKARDKQNIRIYGGLLIGERDKHLGSDGEWGMGLELRGCTNVWVYDTIAINCWGDGFFIGRTSSNRCCENVYLVNVQADNNRRQGISLISGKNVHLINPRIRNTHGTAPQAGIDLEPDYNDEFLEGIYIQNPVLENNAGGGLKIHPNKLLDSGNTISIIVDNLLAIGNGIHLTGGGGSLDGFITFNNPIVIDAPHHAFEAANWSVDCATVTVNGLHVIRPNESGNTSVNWGSAVAVHRVSGDAGDFHIGNVHFINPIIEDPKGNATRAFYFSNDKNNSNNRIANVSVIDPIRCDNPLILARHFEEGVSGRFTLSDKYEALRRSVTVSGTIFDTSISAFIDNKGATESIVLTLGNAILEGTEITFEILAPYSIFLRTGEGYYFFPQSQPNVNQLSSNTIGNSVTVKRMSDGNWRITNMVGNWTETAL